MAVLPVQATFSVRAAQHELWLGAILRALWGLFGPGEFVLAVMVSPATRSDMEQAQRVRERGAGAPRVEDLHLFKKMWNIFWTNSENKQEERNK